MSIDTLRALSVALVWAAIVFPVLGALSAGARHLVDRRIQRLSGERAQQEAAALHVALGDERVASMRARDELRSLRDTLELERARVLALERQARPRDLTPAQQSEISDFLRQYPPHEIGVTVLARDPESERYARELRAAFEAGHWTVTSSTGIQQQPFRGVGVGVPEGDVPVEHPAAIVVLALRAGGIEPRLWKIEDATAPLELKVGSR